MGREGEVGSRFGALGEGCRLALQKPPGPADVIRVKCCFRRKVAGLVVCLLGGTAAWAADGVSARLADGTSEARESWVAEILTWRTKAEQGDVGSQVALAECFVNHQQFVEAVHWYRLAATNGEVTAQLGLAGCLIAGRGVVEDRKEAAFWMRRAADGVERGAQRVDAAAAGRTSLSVTSPAQPALIRTNHNNLSPAAGVGAGRLGVAVAVPSPAGKNLFTNSDSRSTPITRRDTLSALESRTQETDLVLQPFELPK